MRSLPLSYIGSYGGSREKMPLRQFYSFHRQANEVTGAVMSAVFTT